MFSLQVFHHSKVRRNLYAVWHKTAQILSPSMPRYRPRLNPLRLFAIAMKPSLAEQADLQNCHFS